MRSIYVMGLGTICAALIGTFAACGGDSTNDGSAATNQAGAGGSAGGSAGAQAGNAQGGVGGVPNAKCGFGKKECNDDCVPIDDPAYGCNDTSCSPCDIPHGTPSCEEGQCAAGSCETPFDDCDGTATNGCETNTDTDAKNCGSCDNACPPGKFCNGGKCSDTCGTKTKCGSSCVDTNSNAKNCGSCGHVCPGSAHGAPVCSNGHCALSCSSGYSSCSGACVHTYGDIHNCGSCGHTCPSVSFGAPTCSGGVCNFTCQSGYSKCGNKCVKLSADSDNCGACGHGCLGGSCNAGKCAPVVLKSGIGLPTDIAAAGGKVYWLNHDNNTVWSMTTTGAGAKQLAGTAPEPQAMSLVGSTLYWICQKNGEIQKAPTAGCSSGGTSCVTTVYAGAGDGVDKPRDMTVAGSNIYFTSFNKKQVLSIPIGGGKVTTVATEQGGWLTVTTLGSYLVWADYENLVIKRRPLSGGSISAMGTKVKPWAVEGVGADLYFVHYLEKTDPDDEIMKIPGGNSSPISVTKTPHKAGFIASDGTALYWTTVAADGLTGSANRIMKVAK